MFRRRPWQTALRKAKHKLLLGIMPNYAYNKIWRLV